MNWRVNSSKNTRLFLGRKAVDSIFTDKSLSSSLMVQLLGFYIYNMLFFFMSTLYIMHNRCTIHACCINLNQLLPVLGRLELAVHAFTAAEGNLESPVNGLTNLQVTSVVVIFPEWTCFTLITRNQHVS